MTAAEARKKQWESLKDKPLADKLKYIFTYYWPGIVGGVCVLIFLVSWIGGILTQKEVVLSGQILGGIAMEGYAEELQQKFIELQEIDTDKQEFRITDSSGMLSDASSDALATMEAISVRIAVGDIDFLIADQTTFQKFSAYHADLRTVLSQAQLTQWADYLVYVEKAELDALTSDENFESEVILPTYFLSAEGLDDPLPIGFRMPENSRLLQAYKFPKGEVFFGIPHTSQHIDNALAFLEYITANPAT